MNYKINVAVNYPLETVGADLCVRPELKETATNNLQQEINEESRMTKRLIKILKTEKEYEHALERLNEIFDAPENTPEGQEAALLALLISEYEDKHYQIDDPEPIEAIKIRMDDLGLKVKDLVDKGVFTKSGASMILNRQRPLTLGMIRKLSKILTLPIETLAQEYKTSDSIKESV